MLKKFLNYLENEVSHGSIYVWGGQGQKATNALIDKLETNAANKKTAKALLKKRVKAGYTNIKAFDCSGLVAKAMDDTGIMKKGFDTTADGLKKHYVKSLKRWELKPGDLVFRVNSAGKAYHVGVVTDWNLNVIEARGRAYGVVRRKLNASGKGYWNAYGRPIAIKDEIEENAQPFILKRLLKKKVFRMRGDDVKTAQKMLINSGYPCGKDGADGIFGNYTDLAVRAFQAAHKLKADGIVGKTTITALGGKWGQK